MSTTSKGIIGMYGPFFGLPQVLRTGLAPRPNRRHTIASALCILCTLSGLTVQGQGLVNFNNNLGFEFRRTIYGVNYGSPFTQVRGDSGLFNGPLVSGSGNTAGLWAGPLGSTEDALVLLGTTTFRTGGAAGLVVPVLLPCPVVPPGQRVTFQVRAWDNQGGTVTSWEQARTGNFGAYGSSAVFSPPGALGALPLDLIGLESFNLVGPKSLTNFVADCSPVSRGTIEWFGVTPLFIQQAVTTLDIDRDAVSDVSAWQSGIYGDETGSYSWYDVSALATNSLLAEGNGVFLRPAGYSIGSVAPSNAAWSSPGQQLLVTAVGGGWSAPLGLWRDGYAGLRFHAADGWHYGWLHIQFTPWLLSHLWPAITEWAYETRPDVPICAGAKPVTVLLATPLVIGRTQLRLRWSSTIGKAYQVQCKTQLLAPRWTNLGPVVLANATDSTADFPFTGDTCFLRVVETKSAH